MWSLQTLSPVLVTYKRHKAMACSQRNAGELLEWQQWEAYGMLTALHSHENQGYILGSFPCIAHCIYYTVLMYC